MLFSDQNTVSWRKFFEEYLNTDELEELKKHPNDGIYTVQRNITHSKEFAGNQGKHQNFDPAILPHKFGLILMGMK